jgi:dTDP-4-amino-4,6-dideoxygalactose transaminase
MLSSRRSTDAADRSDEMKLPIELPIEDGGQPRLVRLQIIPGQDGVLGVAEASKQVGFPIRRMYFLTGLKKDSKRPGHAHRTLQQCFICLRGAVTIDLEKHGHRSSFRLDDLGLAMVLPPGFWRDLRDFTDDALLVVLASQEYDESDYIRNVDVFRAWELEASQQAVPYLDLARYSTLLGGEFHNAISDVIRQGRFIGGPALAQFEDEFSKFCGASNTVGVGNGLQALVLVLKAWGIGPGDEVILPANTFVGTALAISEVGATPVLVDVEEDTGLMQAEVAAAAITACSRAIIPVHLYGHPVDMDPFRLIAERHGLLLLEDACQAHGARYKGQRCGVLGDAAAFSFYPTKNLGALGDGGAVVTNDAECAGLVRQLGNYGSNGKYSHELPGTNSRLDPLQAAVLSTKLRYLDAWNDRRRAHAARYVEALSSIDDLALPAVRAWAEPVWHAFVVRVRGDRRDALQSALTSADIGTNIHYPIPVHRQACYAAMGWREGAYPIAEQRAAELLSLPLDPMHTEREIDIVIDAVRGFFAGRIPPVVAGRIPA